MALVRRKLSLQIVGSGKLAMEECVGGAEIWQERQRKRCGGEQGDSDKSKLPPMKLLLPLEAEGKNYIEDFEAYKSSLEKYPPVDMSVDAEFEW